MAKVSMSVVAFRKTSTRFCKLLDSHAGAVRADFALKVYRQLPVLIAAAAQLPNAKPVAGKDKVPRQTVKQNMKTAKELQSVFADWDLYLKIFDPTDNEREPVHGLLSDDLADIYRDLDYGIQFAKHGNWNDAVFHWRFGFYSHWGKHAIDALEVLHSHLSEINM